MSESDTPEKQLEACKAHSQQNISNQVCSVCLCLHCFAKTTEQQGVMVIKETALQLQDAVLRPPCWQASVREQSEPLLLKGGLPHCHLGRISMTASETLGRWAYTLQCRLCVVLQHFGTHYTSGRFIFGYMSFSRYSYVVHPQHSQSISAIIDLFATFYLDHMKKWHQQNSLVHGIWCPNQPRVTFLWLLHEIENWTSPPWLLHQDGEFPKG